MPRQSLESLLESLNTSEHPGLVPLLGAVVDWLRPDGAETTEDVVERIQQLHDAQKGRSQKGEQPAAPDLRKHLQTSMAEARHLSLYTEIGLFSRRGFVRELGQRFYERINPRPRNPENLRDVLSQVFNRPGDTVWVTQVPDDAWILLLDALVDLDDTNGPALTRAREQVLYSLEMLSLWVAAEELEPELLRLDPDIAERNSPFVALERELSAYVRYYAQWLEDPKQDAHDDEHARVLLQQCMDQVDRFHKRAVTHGSSMSLTHLLERLDQTLTRISDLLDILKRDDNTCQRCAGARLFREMVVQNARQRSLRALWQDNIKLVSRSITEQSGETGEHYITQNRREYLQMLGSGAGAGLIIAFMALIKIQLMQMGLSPGVETFWVSLNYGLGFVLIHILHFTVATKQPAMTAARLSAAIEAGEKGAANQAQIARLLIQVGRSQFVAVLGNVSLALPVALLVGWASLAWLNQPVMDEAQMHYHLLELRPLAGLAIFHAAIAGVWLFVAGLIAGYFDNRSAYLQLGARLRDNPLLARVTPMGLRHRIADYLDKNYGALMGNFLFGVLLGVTGFIGLLLGLPLDIRHVAFASANLGYVASIEAMQSATFLMYFLFVLVIGAVNLWVSFALAMYVALRSRGVRLGDLRQLMRAYGRELRKDPQGFLLPPRHTPEDSQPKD
ncbi:site-specific recombinase [Ectothiorhodospira haloalkaliphila]|uniref:site-specific recombinase n=1 Tax=Ectothiorhodospira haloalkaliphila TaxID=421628 RepID=UPI001EE97272|nr:site-specific recombinase [Ectothiorhodospira haloalkaliphila]MCG5524052.1 site-specific recombinase [Ectothiorhodospira haloalkaliphila]